MQSSDRSPGTITLIGSGEMSPTMSKVHRTVMSRIGGPVRAVFLDTPAGFELNADQISSRAVQYFKKCFDVDLAVASFKAATAVTLTEMENTLRRLQRANYIFAGPGSPTYAIRNWQNTPIREAMALRLASGAHLVFASAAAIAMGRHALPVYEIYKVGEDPHWVEGLNLLGTYGLELAIVTHWNNTEGGTYDTRYCYMGEPRLRLLEKSLPDSATILGIDEHTACIVDLGSRECQVMGVGQVTIRREGSEVTYATGAVFGLDQLKGAVPAGEEPEAEETPSEYLADFDWPDAVEDETAGVAPFVELLIPDFIRAQHDLIYAGNLLLDGDCIVGVVDYDKARWRPRVLEVAEALIYFARDRSGHFRHIVYSGVLDLGVIRQFLAAYTEVVSLSESEI